MFCRIYPKSCTRCGGDLSLEQDNYGTYLACIQCGAVVDEPPILTRVYVNSRLMNGRQHNRGQQLAAGGKPSHRLGNT